MKLSEKNISEIEKIVSELEKSFPNWDKKELAIDYIERNYYTKIVF